MPIRPGGRKADQLRKVRITPDFLSHPAGSCLIEMGGTRVICAASFEPGVPGWMRSQGVSGGWVTSEYGLMPASTGIRTQREASKGKQSGRTMEIQRLIGRSFRSVIDLEALGPNTMYIDCDVIDADGGTRCASITGASVALQLAFRRLVKDKVLKSVPMRENVAAVSVGMFQGECILDLCYEEDSQAGVDMNVVMTESGKFIEIQGTAEETPFTRQELDKFTSLAEQGIRQLFQMQTRAIGPGPEPDNQPFGNIGDALSGVKV